MLLIDNARLHFALPSAIAETEEERQEQGFRTPSATGVPGPVSQRQLVGPYLLERVEALAVAHHSYYALLELCSLNQDHARLHDHMLRWAAHSRD